MIRTQTERRCTQPREWHSEFLKMMPIIEEQARFAFRSLDPERREDAVQEVLASTALAYRRLVERGKADVAFPCVLARYAIAQFRSGRRVGSRTNSKDLTSGAALRHRCARIHQFEACERDGWRQVVIEDRRTDPATIACFRIDFAEWLQNLPSRQAQIAGMLVTGETPTAVAKRFQISRVRVTQIRHQLRASWESFQTEDGPSVQSQAR